MRRLMPQRVFLSYTSELERYPADRSFVNAAQDAVIRDGDAVTHMAYFTARDFEPARLIAALVAKSDDPDVDVGLCHQGCDESSRLEVPGSEIRHMRDRITSPNYSILGCVDE